MRRNSHHGCRFVNCDDDGYKLCEPWVLIHWEIRKYELRISMFVLDKGIIL